jgi:hypothetical protein
MIPTRAMALEHGIASALVRATERFVPGAASHEPTMPGGKVASRHAPPATLWPVLAPRSGAGVNPRLFIHEHTDRRHRPYHPAGDRAGFLLTGIGTMLVVLTNRLGASSTARACWKTGSTSVTTISIWMS